MADSEGRLEVAASGLSLVMSTFPVLIGPKGKKRKKIQRKRRKKRQNKNYKKREEKQTEKKRHNITNLATCLLLC